MAFYNNQDEEQENVENQGGIQSGPQSSIISGAGGAPGSGPQGAQAPGTPDKPGNFVGLKDYLNANKKQSQKLGDQVAGRVTNAVNDANQEIGAVGDKFTQKVNEGQIANAAGAKDEGLGIINQAATSGNVSADQANRFKDIAKAEYKGPNSLQDATDISQNVYHKAQNAQKQADATKTESGRQEILRGMNNSPQYTTGAQRFDAYLLNNQDTQGKLAQAREGAGAVAGNLSAAEQAAQAQAQNAKSQAQITQEAIRNAFGRFDDPSTPQNEAAGALGNYETDIRGQLKGATDTSNALAGRVNSGALTAEDLALLGLQNDSTYGVNYANYFQGGTPTLAGVTDPEERARYMALASLSDDVPNLYGGASEADFGAYRPSGSNEAFQQAVNEQKNLWENVKFEQMKQNAINSAGAGGTVDAQFLRNAAGAARNADELEKAFRDYAAELQRRYYGSSKTPDQIYREFVLPNASPGFDQYLSQLQNMRGQRLVK